MTTPPALMGPDDIAAALDRMGDDILAAVDGLVGVEHPRQDLCVVGVRRGGAYLADRLARRLRDKTGADVPLGLLDITLYRDDVLVGRKRPLPTLLGTEIDFSIRGRPLVLVDDVLFTGRTIRAALDALLDLGRPRRVWLAVLVDRGLRELPIAADVTGQVVSSGPDQHVVVELTEAGEAQDRVVIVPAETP